MTPEKKQELKDRLYRIATENNVWDAVYQIGEVMSEVIDALPEYSIGIDPAHDQ